MKVNIKKFAYYNLLLTFFILIFNNQILVFIYIFHLYFYFFKYEIKIKNNFYF